MEFYSADFVIFTSMPQLLQPPLSAHRLTPAKTQPNHHPPPQMQLKNQIQVFPQMPNVIFIPLYVRGFIKELEYVTVTNKESKVRCCFFFAYSFNINEETVGQTNSQKVRSQQDIDSLRSYLQSNFSVCVGKKEIEITPQLVQKALPLNDQNLAKEGKLNARPIIDQQQILKEGKLNAKMSYQDTQNDPNTPLKLIQQPFMADTALAYRLSQQDWQERKQFQEELSDGWDRELKLMEQAEDSEQQQEEESDEDQGLLSGCFVAQLEQGSRDYVTYLVEGSFTCSGRLCSIFFPYHQIQAELLFSARSLYFRDIVLKFHFMTLNPIDYTQTSQFFFRFNQPQWRTFGIYQIDHQQLTIAPQVFNDDDQAYVSQIKLPFTIFSFNLPFILRTQVSLWVIFFAVMQMYFVTLDNISGIYANVILFGVVGIQLLSNYMLSSYTSQVGSLYALCLLGMLAIPVMVMINLTLQYYDDSISNEQELHEDRQSILYASIGIPSVLFVVKMLTLIYYGVKARRIRKSNSLSHKVRNLNMLWGEDILRSQITFKELREIQRRKRLGNKQK